MPPNTYNPLTKLALTREEAARALSRDFPFDLVFMVQL
jgi:hypothetical protein